MGAKFGPAGNSESFKAMGYRKTLDVPDYIRKMDLDAYEYQCGRGVAISQQSAKEFGDKAREYGVTLSLHAPYYISLSSTEEEKRLNSIGYILQSAAAADAMGAQRVIVHSGSCAKLDRKTALELAKDTLKRAYQKLDEEGYSNIILCPETMGKINQLGTLEEVLELCLVDERLCPCIDFGHLNARTNGLLNVPGEMKKVFDTMENMLGKDRASRFHAHFSKIEYTEKGGEKKHLTFEDTIYGPNFEPAAEEIVRRGCSPTIICESAGTQAEDALYMKRVWQERSRG